MFEYYETNDEGEQEEVRIDPPFGPPMFNQQYQSPFGPPMFNQQFQPPFGPPMTFPGQSYGPPFGQQQEQSLGPPSGPPPSITPSLAQAQSLAQGPGVYAVDPGAIRPCRFRYVYLWLTSGEQFWAWLYFIGRRSAAGWRWTGFRWIYFGIDLDNIRSFVCY